LEEPDDLSVALYLEIQIRGILVIFTASNGIPWRWPHAHHLGIFENLAQWIVVETCKSTAPIRNSENGGILKQLVTKTPFESVKNYARDW